MFSAVHASVRRRAPEVPNPIRRRTRTSSPVASCMPTDATAATARRESPTSPVTLCIRRSRDLPAAGTQYSEAQIFWIAKHGIRHSGMFANGKWDSDEKLWTITAYIAA